MSLSSGYLVGCVLFSLQIFRSVCRSYLANAKRRSVLVITSMISTAIIEKKLRLSSDASSIFTAGTNMQLLDTSILSFGEMIHEQITSAILPFRILISCVLLAQKFPQLLRLWHRLSSRFLYCLDLYSLEKIPHQVTSCS